MVQIPNAPRLGDMPSGEPIPEGIYALRCDKAEYKLSAQNKTPMAECTFTVFGPTSAEEFHGRKVFENLMLAGEGMFRTRDLLTKTGEADDFILDDTDLLVGREVGAVVQIEKERKETEDGPNKGKIYPAKNKVARFLEITEVE